MLRESPGLTGFYRFTDVAGQPLREETLDVNEDFAAQSFADATADVVVAGHTPHHAANIGRAPARIRDLLVPGGASARSGVIFPAVPVWHNALHATGFVLKAELSAGDRSSVRHHLFHAVRETA